MTTSLTPGNLACSSIRLAAVLTAVGLSREFVRQTLRQWRLPDQIDGAALVVSELVTNAVKSTGITDATPKWEDVRAQHIVGVQLRAVGASLFVEVWDRGDGAPVIQEQTLDAEGGRGLFLVESLSRRWGIHRPAVGGKVVWSELALTSALNPLPPGELTPRCGSGGRGRVAGAEYERAEAALAQRVVDDGRRSAEPGRTEQGPTA